MTRERSDLGRDDARRARLAELGTLEGLIGGRLPDDYRDFVLDVNGREWWANDAYVVLYPVAEVISLFEVIDSPDGQRSRHPGLLYIGGDGGGEGLAYDLRQPHPPLVLVNYVSAGWGDGLLQARGLTEFLEAVEVRGWDLETAYPGQ